jgi:membrane protease YdiL (CAAX protease family)
MRATGQPLPGAADFGRLGGNADLPPARMFLALIPLNGYSEEVGWRGFALPRLQQRHSALAASLLLAVPWALWHLPTFQVLGSYRGIAPAMFPGFVLGLACGSIVLAWLYNGSGGSLWLVAVYHGALNFVTATLAAHGFLAAMVSTCVMLNAGVLVALEWNARRHGRRRPLEMSPAGIPARGLARGRVLARPP